MDKTREKAIHEAARIMNCAQINTTREWNLYLARAAIEAYEEAMWRPIEEAPRNGTKILACLDFQDNSEIQIQPIYYDDTIYEDGDYPWVLCWSSNDSAVPKEVPIAFRPLPYPPQKKGGEDE